MKVRARLVSGGGFYGARGVERALERKRAYEIASPRSKHVSPPHADPGGGPDSGGAIKTRPAKKHCMSLHDVKRCQTQPARHENDATCAVRAIHGGQPPRPARSRPLEQPTAPPARRRDDAKRLPLVLSLLAALAITFVLTENRRIERRSHFEEKTRRGTDDLRERRIPPVIWQTWRSRPDPATPLGRQVRLLKARNPSHQYHFVDDKAQAAFMRTNFTGEVAEAYFSIDPENGAARADLWRYCVLWKFGGWYVDLDVGCRAPLQDFIQQRTSWPSPTSVRTAKGRASIVGLRGAHSFDQRVAGSYHRAFRRRCIAQNIIGVRAGVFTGGHRPRRIITARDETCPRGLVSAGIYPTKRDLCQES